MLAYYISHFEAIYQGEPWFGESFEEKLKGLSDQTAFQRPAPEAHSIAELLHHCIYWRAMLIKRLEGDLAFKGSMKSEENWLPLEKLKLKGWKKILEDWHASQHRLLEGLRKAPDNFLSLPYRNGHTHAHLVEGVLQHDIYHLGQIGLVRSLLKV
jgi:uncharacterized damage-inducible protein DinB